VAEDVAAGDVIGTVLLQASGGLILGFAAGYATKKAVKIALLIIGLFTAGLLALQYYGIISVNWDKLALLVERAVQGAEATAEGLQAFIIGQIPFAGSFLAGFALGFKYG